MAATKRLSESFAAPLAGGTVDREAGIVRGVLVCGFTSANGRRYPWGKGLTVDPKVYEGRPVNADHGQKATCDRRLGWLANVTTGADGRPRADLHVLKSHPIADRVFEAAERNPALFGLSHVALAKTRMEGGTEVIESIQSVESVDLVAEPATTTSLYESKHMPTTLKKFLESIAPKKPAAGKWAAAKWVKEMDEMPMDMPPAEPMAADTPDGDADDAVMTAFKAAISGVVDKAMSGEMDPKEALNKIKLLLKSHGDINGDGKVDAADVDAATDDTMDEAPAMESKGAKFVLAAIKDIEAAGLKVTAESIDLVGSLPAAKRPALFKTLKESAVKPAEKVTTAGRDSQAKTIEEATGRPLPAGATPPTKKSVVESIKGK